MSFSPLPIRLPVLLMLLAFGPVFLWMGTGVAYGQEAVSAIDRDTLQTGTRFTYHVRLTGVEVFDAVVYPDSADFAPDFLIRSRQVERDERGDTLVYQLVYFGVDGDQVPELQAGLVRGTDTLQLAIPEVPFGYRSRVEDPEADLRPLKPIFPFFRSWWPFLLLGLVLAAIAAWLMYRYRKKIVTEPEPVVNPVVQMEPFRNPLDDLRRELDRIRYAYGEPHRLPKQFYTDLGDAFRSYFEQAYKFPALESTTWELIRHLKSHRVNEEVVELTSLILQEADLVKFAKYKPNEAACKNVMKSAQLLFSRISETDRYRMAVLRKKHEEQQKAKVSEDTDYDMG